jgi:hypothetical protein
MGERIVRELVRTVLRVEVADDANQRSHAGPSCHRRGTASRRAAASLNRSRAHESGADPEVRRKTCQRAGSRPQERGYEAELATYRPRDLVERRHVGCLRGKHVTFVLLNSPVFSPLPATTKMLLHTLRRFRRNSSIRSSEAVMARPRLCQ